MEHYSITFELYGKRRRTLKDPIINMAKINRATSIDVDVDVDFSSVDYDLNYEIKISFPDEKTLNKFIRDVDEYLKNV